MRLAVAGNQWITAHLIERLAEAGSSPALLINMGEHWADRISGYTDLAPLAERLGAGLYRPKNYNLKSAVDEETLGALPMDALFVFGWQRLVPEWLIDRCSKGVWGVHGGPEKPPRCRGRAVFNWALALGCERFYMYLFRITPGVDEGLIADLREFSITPDDDILTLYHKNCVVSTAMFTENLPRIRDGSVRGDRQAEEGATYLPKREPEDGGIAWTQPARRIANLIRAVAPPYPGAFTELEGVRVFIERGHVFDDHIAFRGAPGEIVETFPNGDFVVQTGDGAIYVRAFRAASRVTIARGRRFALASGRQPPDPVF